MRILEQYIAVGKFFFALRRGHFTLSDSVLGRLLLKNDHQILEGNGILIQNRDP